MIKSVIAKSTIAKSTIATRLINSTNCWLLLSMLSAGSMGYYVVTIWAANQPPRFNDFYAPWRGARELLLERRNPYSPQVAHEIQTEIYGAPAASTSPDDPLNIAGGFAYPPYSALLLWPTLRLSFSVALKVFLAVSGLLALLTLVLWLSVLRHSLSPVTWITTTLFVLGSFPVLQALKLENLSLIASALIAATVALLSVNRLVLAGIFLAVSTFKPQFTIALVPWLALWTIGDWRRRRRLIWSFLATMFLLVVVSEWLVPGCIRSFIRVVGAYRHYTYGHSLLDVWFTPAWGPVAAASVLVAVLVICAKYRSQAGDSQRFLLVTSLLLAATVVTIPTLAPHAQILLLPGVLCLLRDRTLMSSSGALKKLVLAATWSLLAWPWLAACGLLLAALRSPTSALLPHWEVPLYTSPLLPLAVLLGLWGLLFATPASGDRNTPGKCDQVPALRDT